MRLPGSSSHDRVTASVPAVRDDSARPPGGAAAPEPPPARDRRFSRPGGPALLVGGLLLLIVVAGIVLRLVNNGYGLPYIYNYDESQHFVSRSVNIFEGTWNPGYYQNPAGYTYLMYVAMKLWYGVFGAGLHYGTVAKQFAIDPTPIWEFARTFTALIAIAGVLGMFFMARRWWGNRVALVAAALMTFAFLPVTYSRIAVTDVGTFLPVAIAMYGALRVYERGRLRDYLISGAGIGLATGFKYTAGLVLLPLVVAGLVRVFRDESGPLLKRPAVRYLIAGGALSAVVFFITTPFALVHPHDTLYQLRLQAQAAGEIEKVGQAQQGGFSYYFHTLGWGFGWAALAFAAAGAVLEVWRDRLRGLILLIFPLALFLYMSVQTRYFGRWLLMMYPLLALFAGIAVVRLAELVRSRGRYGWALSGALAAVLTALLLIQPLAADVRTTEVLGRADTRQIARDYLVSHFGRSLRIVIEPAVQTDYYLRPPGKRKHGRQFVQGFVRDLRRQQKIDAPLGADTTYASSLTPDNIDAYRSAGFCLVMTNSLTRGRAENAQVPQALAYYKRLEAESTHLLHLSPFKPGRKPLPLHFDFSYNYYPTAYYRPGGVVDLYQLKDCTQGYHRVRQHPYGLVGLQKGVGSAYSPKAVKPGGGATP
jgi:4-amino-4-deoxy-L-arabinose transferase-like glycosyltransferase